MIKSIKNFLVDKYYKYNYSRALHAFNIAVPYRSFLPEEKFEDFIKKYGKLPAHPNQCYTISGMNALADERLNLIKSKIDFQPGSILEIGPGEGFVLKKFKEEGVNKAVGVDIKNNLHPEAINAGVEIVLTSAENMSGIPDKSFDLVVSWSALEHIPDPQAVFLECLRILKPGGYLFLQFGPLYYSAWGYHHYTVLRCPYLHLLFPEHLIHQHAKKLYGESFEAYLPWTNGLQLAAYRFLNKPLPYGYLLESYSSGYENLSPSSKMIIEFPGIFKSKNVPFENFFVDWMQIGIYRKEN